MEFTDYDSSSDGITMAAGLALVHNMNLLAAAGQGLLNSMEA